MRATTRIGELLFLELICVGTAKPQTPPAFTVASVKPVSQSRYAQRPVSPEATATTFRCVCSLPSLILYAYALRRDDVIFPPDLKEAEWFQISAIFPEPVKKDVPLMVRRLLAERFGLVAHRETRPKPVYALIVDKKGLKLNPVKPPGTMEDVIRNPPHSFVRLRIEGRIDRLQIDGTGTLDEIARALRLDRPVINMTGIPGRFDYAIDAMIPAASGPPFILANGSVIPQTADDTPGLPGSIFTEIRKFGLVLEPRKTVSEFLVLDHLNRKPTGN
jgi:uncharacterized protein (TIGR03435 family)